MRKKPATVAVFESNATFPAEAYCFKADDLAAFSRSLSSKIALHSTRNLNLWLARQMARPKLTVKAVSLHETDRWLVHEGSGNVCHESGRFFTITGVQVRHRTDCGEVEWDQPLIEQPEIGILGILVKKIRGVLHFCLQAKEEPGNINSVQLSPTVQATYSNYMGAHGGARPLFLEHFIAVPRERLLFARLQSEDGGRFLYKSNRNMLVRADDSFSEELPDGFVWLTLAQIARLVRRENLLHATTRSVLSVIMGAMFNRSGSPPHKFNDTVDSEECISSINDAFQWLDDVTAVNHILVKRKGLNELQEWGLDRDGSFSHNEGRFFRVIGIQVAAAGREVATWSQPILDSPGQGVIGLLMKKSGGESYFLMQAKAEVGNRSIVQIAPTVQFTPGNYIGNEKLPKPFLFDEFQSCNRFQLLYEGVQSEEGARFFREAHLHRILLLPEGDELALPPGFRWISAAHLSFLLGMGGMVNSCARSILSCLLCLERVS